MYPPPLARFMPRRAPHIFAIAAAVAALAATTTGCGEDPSNNAERYSGEAKRVAQVIDDFEQASRDDDATRICDQLFTARLAGTVGVGSGHGCVALVKSNVINKDAKL